MDSTMTNGVVEPIRAGLNVRRARLQTVTPRPAGAGATAQGWTLPISGVTRFGSGAGRGATYLLATAMDVSSFRFRRPPA